MKTKCRHVLPISIRLSLIYCCPFLYDDFWNLISVPGWWPTWNIKEEEKKKLSLSLGCYRFLAGKRLKKMELTVRYTIKNNKTLCSKKQEFHGPQQWLSSVEQRVTEREREKKVSWMLILNDVDISRRSNWRNFRPAGRHHDVILYRPKNLFGPCVWERERKGQPLVDLMDLYIPLFFRLLRPFGPTTAGPAGL